MRPAKQWSLLVGYSQNLGRAHHISYDEHAIRITGAAAIGRSAAAAKSRRDRRPGASARSRRPDRADGGGRAARLDDPVGAAGLRQDDDRAAAGARAPTSRSSRCRRCFPASPICARCSRRRRKRREMGQGTLLFVDEIHRFNRAQQDAFLPYVEDGTVILVGATTENPSFELNRGAAVAGQVLVLRRLDDAALETLLARAEAHLGRALPLTAGRPRRAARDGRRRRAVPAQPGRGDRRGCRREPRARAATAGRAAAAPRAALRQGPGGPLQPDQRPAQIAARLRHRRGALLAGAHAGRRRGPDLHPAPADPRGGRGYRPRRPAGPGAGARRQGRL